MSRKYTERECLQNIAKVYESGDLSKLYDKPFIKNWNGTTIDTKREYQEIFAEYIYNRVIDGRLPMINICGVQTYCEFDRQDAIRDNEEGVQRNFYYGRQKLDAKFGKPVWFELQTNKVGQGKGIDLVYYNEATSEINIFELKYKNEKESLLRAVMEIQTYYQRVDWYRVIGAFKKRDIVQESRIAKINKYILVDENSKMIKKKYDNIRKEEVDSYVKKLLEAFHIEVVVYD